LLGIAEVRCNIGQTGFENTLLNVVRLVKGVSPGMKKVGWGRIVHITSGKLYLTGAQIVVDGAYTHGLG
jgi:NAD(P)-dependent dehydrogenase (short-subunit alcohol dehydrogenase family)